MGNEQYGQSSQYAWSPGMESTFIDHLLLRPRTSWRGVRGVRAQFGGLTSEEEEDAADDLAIEQAEEPFWDIPSATLRMLDPDDVADFDSDMEEDIDLDEELAELQFEDVRSRGFGALSGTIGVEAWPGLDPSGLTRADILESTAIDDLVAAEDALEEEDEYGRLYLHQSYEMMKASDGDLGTLAGQSGSSGYRGGRPTFGTNGGNVSMGPFAYQGDALPAFALGLGALLVMAKVNGAI